MYTDTKKQHFFGRLVSKLADFDITLKSAKSTYVLLASIDLAEYMYSIAGCRNVAKAAKGNHSRVEKSEA